MNKLKEDFQKEYSKEKQFVYENIREGISTNIKFHNELENVRSSAAACLNVLVYLNRHQNDIIPFFNQIGLNIQKVIDFPHPVVYGGKRYDDEGPIVFEWIGPKKSPINEKGCSRGQNRTSIDAYMLAEVNGKITQLFIEWKFTETYNSVSNTHKFGGKKGIERLRRYSDILAKLRKSNFPFKFNDEDKIGLSDFSYEPFYQLLRMTLLAKMTTPTNLNSLRIDDYKIIHLAHSENKKLNFLSEPHLEYSPGLKRFIGNSLHDTWIELLDDKEKEHHIMEFWNKALYVLSTNKDKKYLVQRYE
jgi:hypothetical protein